MLHGYFAMGAASTAGQSAVACLSWIQGVLEQIRGPSAASMSGAICPC